ncbi:VWA domain-containing protein [Dysgonomonas sp. Marseille-P4677]|uniref:vWA domain-containing protein n=1 Tax=Dysgonomonas sp. Marseille-P4677 TaxID=2364790 RepID=UPI001913E368|nr:VWA domain-containing protein [Dysgonomonas sp. Marseille-P4677]MBK5720222.1 VWA domain-containing protein [Dysgonomonas sp. Marseille-P4677]
MKTYKLGIFLLSGLFFFSCGGNKQKTSTDEAYMVLENIQVEEELPPPPMMANQKFVPPVIAPDEKEMVSVENIVGCDDKQAISIAELKEHKMIVAEEAPQIFCYIAPSQYDRQKNEEYSQFAENTFRIAREEPLSTFSVDVDAASYSNMRRFINKGELPYKDAVRIEELINYFSYNYPEPTGDDPVKITTEVGSCPWNTQNRLVRIGLKAKSMASDNLPASNFVFLIDVSGSMEGPTRLDLVKSSLKLLVNNLRSKDRVAIVVYAGSAGEVLPSTSGENKQRIREALNDLSAGGSTAGGEGIQLAYKIAKKNFIKGGNNRIILCTDGDFNVGVSSNEGLQKLIENERKTGVFLSILGYGMGNYKDSKMQTLAQAGNGNHAYIDNLQEANKVLVNEFGATMYTVAKDVKLQIEFNPANVQAYRLVGYETRLLNKEDFNDDTKDAGEMGAGHTVTAFYEIIPVGIKTNLLGNVDPLKYQDEAKTPIQKQINSSFHPDLLTVKLRYKQPNGDTSKKIEVPLIDNKRDEVSDDFRFASAVAMFGQVMKDSQYKGDGSFDKAILLARSGYSNDSQGYRREFVRLMETAKGLTKN